MDCRGGLLGLTLSGLVPGPNGRLMTICGTVGGQSLDARTGRTLKMITQVGDEDEVWYDPGTNRYYFAHRKSGAAEATSAQSGAIGVVDAAGDAFVADIPMEGAGVHSVAVNARTNTSLYPWLEKVSWWSRSATELYDHKTTVG